MVHECKWNNARRYGKDHGSSRIRFPKSFPNGIQEGGSLFFPVPSSTEERLRSIGRANWYPRRKHRRRRRVPRRLCRGREEGCSRDVSWRSQFFFSFFIFRSFRTISSQKLFSYNLIVVHVFSFTCSILHIFSRLENQKIILQNLDKNLLYKINNSDLLIHWYIRETYILWLLKVMDESHMYVVILKLIWSVWFHIFLSRSIWSLSCKIIISEKDVD